MPAADVAALVARLAAAGETVATCESLTAGLVAATIADVPGASSVLRGGLVTYATDLKNTLAGVPVPVTDAGVVTSDTALAMARGARSACGATWGLATTGVAGPGPHDGVPQGRCWVAVSGPDGDRAERVDLAGDRAAVRRGAVAAATRLLTGTLDQRT